MYIVITLPQGNMISRLKKYLLLAAVLIAFFAGRFVSSRVALAVTNPKVNICHRTNSPTNPWEAIQVDTSSFNGPCPDSNDHSCHGDFSYGGPLKPNGKPDDSGGADNIWCNGNAPLTPLDCVWHWSECSASCGGGIQTVVVDAPPLNGGAACPTNTQSCNEQSCQGSSCENPRYLESYLDKVDLGNSTSEAAHNATGWGADPGSGNYGGRDGGQTFSLVVGKNECNEGGRSAYFKLDAGTNFADKIVIRHLDGLSNLDSFDVFANGNPVGHYTDAQDTAEIWVTNEYSLPNLTGLINIEIKLTDNIWPSCETWGQLAINWVEIRGYECPGEESPSPTPTPTSSGGGGGGVGGPAGAPVCGATTPVAPTLLNASIVGANSIKIQWNKVSGANDYNISYGPASGNYLWGVPSTGDTDNFTINGLSKGCFVVRAVNGCAPSGPSNEVCTGGVLGTQVLGASTMGGTGSFEDNLFSLFFSIGALLMTVGIRRYALSASSKR